MDRLASAARMLTSLSHKGVLARGFALVRDAAGSVIRQADQIAPGATLEIEFAGDSHVRVRAEGEGAATPLTPKKAKKPKAPDTDQGSLF
jgi:exodeoxyribonuclease VII large subunit